jgi:hypothetical protein
MNSVVRSVLVDLATRRTQPDNADELVFKPQPKQSDVFFPRAIERARRLSESRDETRAASMATSGTQTGTRSRHVSSWPGWTFERFRNSGGWKTPSMVSRYAHLARGHLAAVERLVAVAPQTPGAVELAPIRK